MTDYALDHVVIFSAPDAPETKALEAAGLQGFGGVTKHGELGTASTSFFFENTYLELFWVCDEAQLAAHLADLGHDPRERMNWRTSGASPFSLALRRAENESPLPFPATSLRAGWMPGDIYLRFMFAGPAEPVCPVIPGPLQFASWRHNIPQQTHPLGVKAVTDVHIAVTPPLPSPLCQWLTQSGLVTVQHGPGPLMTLTFDDGAQGRVIDVRPALPLVLKV